ncbi:hypothetical protein EDC01DRAFT_630644 [Geopyxis carbonaria]|nr:hypothetical protein EDC01DRAFT_630644 [Geopyxis carbonaria]
MPAKRNTKNKPQTTGVIARDVNPAPVLNEELEAVPQCEVTLAYSFPPSSNIIIPSKDYMCYRCGGLRFSTRYEIYKHDMDIHPKEPGETICPLCPDPNPQSTSSSTVEIIQRVISRANVCDSHFLNDHPGADPTESRNYEAFRIMYGNVIKWQQEKLFEPYDKYAMQCAYPCDPQLAEPSQQQEHLMTAQSETSSSLYRLIHSESSPLAEIEPTTAQIIEETPQQHAQWRSSIWDSMYDGTPNLDGFIDPNSLQPYSYSQASGNRPEDIQYYGRPQISALDTQANTVTANEYLQELDPNVMYAYEDYKPIWEM